MSCTLTTHTHASHLLPPRQVRKTRFQMHKAIDPDYYGFRDEDDGLLERVEGGAEREMRAQVGGRGVIVCFDVVAAVIVVS